MKYIPFLVLLLISILITSAMLLKKDDNNIQNYIIGTKISEFELPSLYEKDDKFNSKIFHSNGWKVLNVFASWCQQCKSEHKYLKKLSKIIPLYGIAYNDNPIKTKRFLDKMGNVYSSVGIDEHGNNAVLIGISGVPETYLIDGQGIIRFKYLGALDDKVLDDYIIPIIEEKKIKDTLKDIARDIRCLVCENQSILESDTDFAINIKNYILESLEKGLNRNEIIDFLSSRYGDFILLSPPVSKYTILLWILPVIVFLFLLFIIINNKNNYLTKKETKQTNIIKTDKKKFLVWSFLFSFLLVTAIYYNIGNWGMADYPQQKILYLDSKKNIDKLLYTARSWREIDEFESPRIVKINQQILSIDKNNVEANWFMAIHNLEIGNIDQAYKYYNSLINSINDLETKKVLVEQWKDLLNSKNKKLSCNS